MKIKGSFLKAARLRKYGGDSIRSGAIVGIGRGRHWRINCNNEFEFSVNYQLFDRWALSKRATRQITTELDSIPNFVKMVGELLVEIKEKEAYHD